MVMRNYGNYLMMMTFGKRISAGGIMKWVKFSFSFKTICQWFVSLDPPLKPSIWRMLYFYITVMNLDNSIFESCLQSPRWIKRVSASRRTVLSVDFGRDTWGNRLFPISDDQKRVLQSCLLQKVQVLPGVVIDTHSVGITLMDAGLESGTTEEIQECILPCSGEIRI